MSDPLSTWASVVGLVGFGQKTCTAVMNYVDGIKSRSQEIESAKKEVQTVRHLLTTIENSTDKISSCHESSKSTVRACLASCHREIAALEALVSELQGSTAVGKDSHLWNNIRDQGKKLTYPFHRSKLDRLRVQLDKVIRTLQVALQVAEIDVVVGIENTVMIMHTSTLPRIQEQIDSVQPRLIADTVQLTDQLLENNRLIREDVSPLLKDLACDNRKNVELVAGILALHRHPNGAGVSQVLEDLSCAGQQILSYRQAVGRLIAKPSQLKELCQIADDQISDTVPNNEIHPNSSFQSSSALFTNEPDDLDTIKPMRSSCSCRQRRVTRQKISAMASWVFSSETSQVQHHLPDCPFRNCVTSAKQTRWEVRFNGLRGLIGCAVSLSFSSSFGAGGFSLSPNFTYYPSVNSSTTPVFRIMALMRSFLLNPPIGCVGIYMLNQSEIEEQAQSFRGFIDLCVDNIMLLYRREKAAPRAIDEYGRSALHHLSNSQKSFRDNRIPSVLLESLRKHTDGRFLGLADKLIRCGVPSMTQDIHGVTPAWDLCISSFDTDYVWARRQYDIKPYGPATIDLICSREPYTPILAQSSLVGGHSFLGNDLKPMFLLPLLRYSQAAAEACECGPLSLAVLAGDEEETASLLDRHPATIQERNLFGQTPLHLSVGRPACLRLMLQGPGTVLLDQPDSSGYTPLEYAALNCNKSCEASMIVMLESDCRVPNQFCRIFSKLCQACSGELLKHIKNRRERLKRFALERLPEAEAYALGLDQTAVLDFKANLVTQALRKRGFEIPSPLRVDFGLTDRLRESDWRNEGFQLHQSVSMFYQSPLNTPYGSNFDALFQLGFRGFGERASDKCSPLSSWLLCPSYVPHYEEQIWEANRIEACIWLINHGANLWDPIPELDSWTHAHFLYESLDLLTEWTPLTDSSRLRIQFLTGTLSTYDVRDDCYCGCSPGGCSPFVWFLRSNTDPKYNSHISFSSRFDRKEYLFDQFPQYLRRWKPVISLEQLRSAIRYLTFEILGIRHTCSHDDTKFGKPTADEIAEIEELMSEDASLLDLLEELVEDFDLEIQSVITERDPLGLDFWETHWSGRMNEVIAKLDEYRMDEGELLSTQQLGVTWHQLDDSPGKHQIDQYERPSYRKIDWKIEMEKHCYRESDWSYVVDGRRIWRTPQSVGEWRYRLDLIMSRAIPDWR